MKFNNGREIELDQPVVGNGDNLPGVISGIVIAMDPATTPEGKDKIRVLTHVLRSNGTPGKNTYESAFVIGSPEMFNHANDAYLSALVAHQAPQPTLPAQS